MKRACAYDAGRRSGIVQTCNRLAKGSNQPENNAKNVVFKHPTAYCGYLRKLASSGVKERMSSLVLSGNKIMFNVKQK